jgi:hypothetical protein
MKSVRLVLMLVALAALCACSADNKPAAKSAEPAKPEKKEPLLYTGREAFQKMYLSAHLWVADAKPYRLESQVNAESNGKDGKATIWRSGFASLTRRGLKSFLWSGSQLPDAASPGVSSGVEDTYNPSNSSTQTFDFAFLKVDSDKAYEVALKHGGDKLEKASKGKGQPVFYILDWSPRENILTWHVIFGTDQQDAKLRVAINASTGDFLRVEK